MQDVNNSVQYVKGVGPKRAKILKKIGIESVYHLLRYFPRDWEDRRRIKSVSEVTIGGKQTCRGIIIAISEEKKKRLTVTKIAVSDKKNIIYAVFFNQPYIKERFPKGKEVILTGKVNLGFYGEKEMNTPEYEVISSGDTLSAGRIVPIYPLTEGLSQRVLRNIIKNALDIYLPLKEFIPSSIIEKRQLKDLSSSIFNIHFPSSFKEKEQSYYRLVFEDFFLIQLSLALRRKRIKEEKGISFEIPGYILNEFFNKLPFKLTSAQIKVIKEIREDMKKDEPMNRLLQGDVGSGKTIVAVFAILIAVYNGYQAALMAPTEILSEQHYLGIKPLLSSFGIKVDLLIGSLKNKEKKEVKEKIRKGETQLIVGTHALIEEEVKFHKLGLIIVDEQHRFGVLQRASLRQKGYNPDTLVMTATPIPRTLSMTLYGDLELSVIDELPEGRKKIKTLYFPLSKKNEVYNFIKKCVKEGRQSYIVCPLISESEILEVQAATKLYNHLKDVFPDFELGLLHSKLTTEDKEETMKKFKERKIDILVSTTVIEVGIDIPNATLMVIENAERFGLAQLHQLRGRVGRSDYQSYCFLLGNLKTEESKARIKTMLKTTDGFTIAEEDLNLRGPGDFFGTRQHGIPERILGNILKDVDILEKAREDAFQLVEEDLKLEKFENRPLKWEILKRFGEDLILTP